MSDTTPSDPDIREDMSAMLEAAGIPVTEEGKARARAKLAAVARKLTPERLAELRAKLGLPSHE